MIRDLNEMNTAISDLLARIAVLEARPLAKVCQLGGTIKLTEVGEETDLFQLDTKGITETLTASLAAEAANPGIRYVQSGIIQEGG